MNDTFGQRLVLLRRTLGDRGERTSGRAFARALAVSPSVYCTWEIKGFRPKRGLDQLAEALARVPAVHARGLDARKLAAWVWTGEGAPPIEPPATRSGEPSTPPGGTVISQTIREAGESPLVRVLRAFKEGTLSLEEAAQTIRGNLKSGLLALAVFAATSSGRTDAADAAVKSQDIFVNGQTRKILLYIFRRLVKEMQQDRKDSSQVVEPAVLPELNDQAWLELLA
jgi:hypothetical protein